MSANNQSNITGNLYVMMEEYDGEMMEYSYGGDIGAWDSTDLVHYQVADAITLFVSPILLVIGLLGNLFSAIVFCWLGKKVLSSCYYLVLLSVIDSILLCQRCGNNWLKQLIHMDITYSILVRTKVSCQVYSFICNFILHIASWLFAVTITEIAFAFYMPIKAHTILTTDRCKHIVLFVLLFLICINAHFFWTYGLVVTYYTRQPDCTFEPHGSYYNDFFREDVWPVIDNATSTFLPNIVISVSIIYICRHKCRNTTKSRILFNNQFLMNIKALRRFSTICIVLGICGLILTLPEAGYNAYELILERTAQDNAANDAFSSESDGDMAGEFFAKRKLAQTVVYTCRDIFLSSKVVVYIICWKSFRNRTLYLIKCRPCLYWMNRKRNSNLNGLRF